MNDQAAALTLDERMSPAASRRMAIPGRGPQAAILSAAALALGSWALSGKPAQMPAPASEPTPQVPSVVAVPAPALDPLVALVVSDRSPSAAEDGLVSHLLRQSALVAPSVAIAPTAAASLESQIPDKRLPEHFERLSLRPYSKETGLAAAPKAYVPPPEDGPRHQTQPVYTIAGPVYTIAGYEMDRAQVVAMLGVTSTRGRGFFRGNVSTQEQASLFPPEFVALYPDKTICRMGGTVCRAPDGKFFALASAAQYEALPAGGLVVFPSPLVFDLDGDGARTTDRTVRFDIDGDGIVDEMNDVSSKDAVLVFDADGDGRSGEQARELFGTETDLDADGRPDGFADGFAALKGFVARARREGVLSAAPAEEECPKELSGPCGPGWLEQSDLAALEKDYGLRVRIGSLRARSVSLREAGIARVRLSDAAPRRIRNFDRLKNDLMRQEGARFAKLDGTIGVYEDVWFRATTPRALIVAAAK